MFSDEEISYIKSQHLARLATVGPDGQPDVVPVGFDFDGTYFYCGGPCAGTDPQVPQCPGRSQQGRAGHR